MKCNATYSPNRLQKAIGNIAGTHLGFKNTPDGGVKPLPQTAAEICEIQKIYPQRRCVDFSFMGSETTYTAYALLDYWHKDGTDIFQPPENLKIPNTPQESSWPHTTPENNSPDLMTLIQLLTLSGAPTAPAMPPIIQSLIQKMGNQQNTVKLLQTLTGTGSLDLKILMQIAGVDPAKMKELTDNAQISNKTPTLPEGETPPMPNIPDTPNISQMEIPKIPPIPEVEIPTEPLYGAVIPLKGDKSQGYLLLGFIKL